jgi:hypothetical protein
MVIKLISISILWLGLIYPCLSQKTSFDLSLATNFNLDLKENSFGDTATTRRLFTPGFTFGVGLNFEPLNFLKFGSKAFYNRSIDRRQYDGPNGSRKFTINPISSGTTDHTNAIAGALSIELIPTKLLKFEKSPVHFGLILERGVNFPIPPSDRSLIDDVTSSSIMQYEMSGWGINIVPNDRYKRFSMQYMRRNLGHEKLHFIGLNFRLFQIEHSWLKSLFTKENNET